MLGATRHVFATVSMMPFMPMFMGRLRKSAHEARKGSSVVPHVASHRFGMPLEQSAMPVQQASFTGPSRV